MNEQFQAKLLEVLKSQREIAADCHAAAEARIAILSAENVQLKRRIAELEAIKPPVDLPVSTIGAGAMAVDIASHPGCNGAGRSD